MINVEEQRGYFAVIPASVRYDSRLIPSAKLLYGEITALSNEKGYCWASNEYFAQLYGVSKPTIQNWLKSLEKFGHIKREIQYKSNTKEIEARIIRITYTPHQENSVESPRNIDGGSQEKLVGSPRNVGEAHQENLGTPHQEIYADNNTLFNNTFNNTEEYIESTPSAKKSKPKPAHHKYGEYKNVPLTDEQLEKLKTEFPDDWKERIERVSEYCELSGKKYKNYLAVIRAWAKKDKQQVKQRSRTYTRQEQLPEWAKEPTDYTSQQSEITEEDMRRFLDATRDEEEL